MWVLLSVGLIGGFITLALLIVEISLVSLTSALATDVGAKVKDMSLIIISMSVYGDQVYFQEFLFYYFIIIYFYTI